MKKGIIAAGILAATASTAFAGFEPENYMRFDMKACTLDNHTVHVIVEMPKLSRAKDKQAAIQKFEAVKTDLTAQFKEEVGKTLAADITTVDSQFNKNFFNIVVSTAETHKAIFSPVFAHEPVTPGCK